MPQSLKSSRFKHASAGNRTRATSMATMYSTTRPLMLWRTRANNGPCDRKGTNLLTVITPQNDSGTQEVSRRAWQTKVMRGFEPLSLDSEWRVVTVTPEDHLALRTTLDYFAWTGTEAAGSCETAPRGKRRSYPPAFHRSQRHSATGN